MTSKFAKRHLLMKLSISLYNDLGGTKQYIYSKYKT